MYADEGCTISKAAREESRLCRWIDRLKLASWNAHVCDLAAATREASDLFVNGIRQQLTQRR